MQLLAPVVTSLALGRPNIVSGLVATAAAALFLAREPAVLALGYRGEEIRREEGWRARRMVQAFVGIGVVCMVVALFLAERRVRLALGAPSVLWLLVAVLTVRHEDKTFAGELVTSAAFSGAGFPIAIAERVSLGISINVWTAWVMGFFAATLAMRSILEKGATKNLRNRAFTWLGALTGIGLALWVVVRISVAIVPAAPMFVAAWSIAGLHPKKKKKAAAYAMALSAVATGAVLVYLTRTPA